MTNFGKNFRQLRINSGLTQEALADALELSTSVINRIENNKRRMDIDLIYKLPAILNKDVSEIINALFEEGNVPEYAS